MIAASMIEDTAAGATDGSAVQDGPRKAKLTLDQKRQLVMMWFTQEEQGRIKDLPAGPGKNFVCRAARDLKLFQLRKLRASSSTEEVQRTSIDDMARRRVMSYHPRKFAAATTVTSPVSAKVATATNLDPARVRSVLLAFYGSTGRDAVPLGRHLRNCGVLDHRAEILAIVRSIQFRRMKRDGVSVEEATARLDEVLAAMSFGKKEQEMMEQEDAVAGCAVHLYAMQIDDGDDLATPLINSKAQRQATRIAERRAQRRAKRQAMVKAKRAAKLLRQRQKQSARQAVQKQQPDKALAILQSNPPLLKLVQSDEAQDLLMEWYSDPSKLSIVDFLRSKDETSSLLDTYKRPLRLLVKAAQLHRLRKAEAGRDKATQAVEDVLARASGKPIGVVAKKGTVAKVTLKKNPKAAATSALAGVTPEHLQHHLMQWFRDDTMPSVVDYLAANELPPDVRPAMAHVIKQLGLRQLRKERHLATVQARRRIKGALLGEGGQKIKPIKGKGGEDTAPTVAAVLPSAPPAKLLEEDCVSVSMEGEEMTEVAPPSYDEAVDDLDFVVLH